MIATCEYTTPVGPLTVLTKDVERQRVIVAAGFCSADALWERLPAADQTDMQSVPDLGTLQQPILDYLAGDVDAIDRIPIEQEGTDLQREVWDGLRAIPAGETKTYRELADGTSRPKAVRAVGTACGKNLVAPFVPCHRALRSDGTLGGYYYGLDVKRWLLDHEAKGQRQERAAS